MAETHIEEQIEHFQQSFNQIRAEIQRVIVGQQDTIENVLLCFFAGGHVLLEGVPGIGKTQLVKTLSEVCQLEFSRIQFTPDLMPADIIGTDVVYEDEQGGRRFEFRPGPIHSQLVLADEINRATPKTQSSLLEAMQEGQVTAGRKTYKMVQPFFVLATQNPIEMEGTYPLPEAQLDRFLLKLRVTFGTKDELKEVLSRTTDQHMVKLEPVIDQDGVIDMRSVLNAIVTADNIKDYAVRLMLATHPDSEYAPDQVRQYVRFGSSPRGAQALMRAGKVYAVLEGRTHVDFSDIKRAAYPALRHRILLNFEGDAEGMSTDTIVDTLLAHVPERVS